MTPAEFHRLTSLAAPRRWRGRAGRAAYSHRQASPRQPARPSARRRRRPARGDVSATDPRRTPRRRAPSRRRCAVERRPRSGCRRCARARGYEAGDPGRPAAGAVAGLSPVAAAPPVVPGMRAPVLLELDRLRSGAGTDAAPVESRWSHTGLGLPGRPNRSRADDVDVLRTRAATAVNAQFRGDGERGAASPGRPTSRVDQRSAEIALGQRPDVGQLL